MPSLQQTPSCRYQRLFSYIDDNALSNQFLAHEERYEVDTMAKAHSFVNLQVSLHGKKKFSGFPVPSRDVTYQTLPGQELLIIPWRESWVSDILAGNGKTANLFFTV
jgi:hypothetical protein